MRDGFHKTPMQMTVLTLTAIEEISFTIARYYRASYLQNIFSHERKNDIESSNYNVNWLH